MACHICPDISTESGIKRRGWYHQSTPRDMAVTNQLAPQPPGALLGMETLDADLDSGDLQTIRRTPRVSVQWALQRCQLKPKGRLLSHFASFEATDAGGGVPGQRLNAGHWGRTGLLPTTLTTVGRTCARESRSSRKHRTGTRAGTTTESDNPAH